MRVRTAHGDAIYELPDGASGSLCGLQIDAELLDRATITTDPRRMMSAQERAHCCREAAPDFYPVQAKRESHR